ncbi:hypothetical protein [Actinoplanes sp. URMC 104]|uniref:hypothetical protein n=1 Tax=Actinoplanes sp. URMC 104 TaxID=3423409 RepID=UPI003F1BC76F
MDGAPKPGEEFDCEWPGSGITYRFRAPDAVDLARHPRFREPVLDASGWVLLTVEQLHPKPEPWWRFPQRYIHQIGEGRYEMKPKLL